VSRAFASHPLRFPIVRETRDAAGAEHEEELRPAGFVVELKRPRAKDLKIMDRFQGQDVGGSIALIAQLSNLSVEEAELLDAVDLGELGNLLDKPASDGPATGPTA